MPRAISSRQRGAFMCREVDHDDNDAPVLLWVHGLGESGLCFERLLVSSELAQYRHCAPDLVGYGRSTWEASAFPLSLNDHALQLRQFIKTELTGSVVVIGHSMGGVIGQILCESEPDSVRAFVNLEGNLSIGDCGYSSKASPQSLQQFQEHGFALLAEQIYLAGNSDAAHRTYFASYCLSRPGTFHLNSLELVALSEAEELAPRFAALNLRTAFVQGSPNGAPARSAELLRANGIAPVVFEPAGHWPFVDQHQEFSSWLAGLLQSWKSSLVS